MEAERVELLSVVEDHYGGVVVSLENQEPVDSELFSSILEASMNNWKQQRKKGVWLKLPILHSNLVHTAVKAGFKYHHAEPEYLMLVRWIPETPDTFPANASHRVGVAVFVVNDKKEMLVVQEKSGVFGGTALWKMPTGVVNEGEDLCDGAIREVKEETGWMPVEDYAAQPFVQEHEQFDFVAKICSSKLDGNYTGFSNVPTCTSSGKKTYLYLSNRDASLLLASKQDQA
ncbi:hypothetical protein VIGAN_03007600 [Vigna angularis var. angularis]|uniref:Nudix hydrolase domain-containing protein n=1 Tax=Vigna angularis var. angularis TaxID=157739 RepID=A0A0S3RIL8_PHAAN|nr:hypothetical protein VIGAN_03007600 [Vigna angularis var. angularis]